MLGVTLKGVDARADKYDHCCRSILLCNFEMCCKTSGVDRENYSLEGMHLIPSPDPHPPRICEGLNFENLAPFAKNLANKF